MHRRDSGFSACRRRQQQQVLPWLFQIACMHACQRAGDRHKGSTSVHDELALRLAQGLEVHERHGRLAALFGFSDEGVLEGAAPLERRPARVFSACPVLSMWTISCASRRSNMKQCKEETNRCQRSCMRLTPQQLHPPYLQTLTCL